MRKPQNDTDNIVAHIGFSLLEVMIVITITGLLAAMSGPSIVQSLRHQQLKGSIQSSYFLMQQARSTAIAQSQNMTVQFEKGEKWCIALSDSGPCDCQIESVCTVNGIEYRMSVEDYPHIQFSQTTMGKDHAIVFDGIRGTSVGNAGSGVFSNGTEEVKLIVSNLGRIRICMQQGQLGAFQAC